MARINRLQEYQYSRRPHDDNPMTKTQQEHQKRARTTTTTAPTTTTKITTTTATSKNRRSRRTSHSTKSTKRPDGINKQESRLIEEHLRRQDTNWTDLVWRRRLLCIENAISYKRIKTRTRMLLKGHQASLLLYRWIFPHANYVGQRYKGKHAFAS